MLMAHAEAEAVRAALKGRAYEALATVREAPPQAVTVRARNRLAEVRLTLAPRGATGVAAGEGPPGNFFSPVESAVWLSLADGQPRIGKRIAAEIRQKLTGQLKVILRNLCDRGVLLRDGAGYRRAR